MSYTRFMDHSVELNSTTERQKLGEKIRFEQFQLYTGAALN